MRKSDPGRRHRRAEPDLIKRRRAAQEAGERINRSDDAKEREKLYKSREWRSTRAAVLREEPFCRMCGSPATVVDHIEHGPGWRDRFFLRKNLRGLCKPCHDKRSAQDRHRMRKARAVLR
jgi:5-methylcytosine-specific restriction endonuclease McrA